jgi:hypothetical protein
MVMDNGIKGLRIKAYHYHGSDGFLVYGHARVSIFTDTRTSAERIRAKLASGEELSEQDFAA